MSLIAEGTVVSGKLKYFTRNEQEKQTLKLAGEFVKNHEGQRIFIELHSGADMSFQKNLPMYFEKIILPPLFVKMKDEYGLSNVGECKATLSLMFATQKKIKPGTDKEYSIAMRINEMSLVEQGDFIAKVANMAVTKYQLKFPNANEIDNSL